jgi:hypothetical protein
MNPFPTTARAGDTFRTVRSWPDYPASAGWVLHVTAVSAAGVINVDGTADGDNHVLAVSADVTAGWLPANYRLVEYVTRGADRHTLAQYGFTVQTDLAAATVAADTRTHAERVLAHVEAFLEEGTESEFEYAGRRLRNYPLPELLALRDRYRAEVRRQSGAPAVGRMLTRFER